MNLSCSHRLAAAALLAAPCAYALNLAPLAGDDLSPVIPALRHDAIVSYHDEGGVLHTIVQNESDDAALAHHVDVPALPAGVSYVATSVRLTVENSDATHPANLLINWPIGDPDRGVRARSRIMAGVTSSRMTSRLSTAREDIGAPPGSESPAAPWRFRLDPTGGEVPGDLVFMRIYGSFDAAASVSPKGLARAAGMLRVNGVSVLEIEALADDETPSAEIDESRFMVLGARVGEVIEIDYEASAECLARDATPALLVAEIPSLRVDVEFRLLRDLADFDNDGVINTADLGRLIGDFGRTGSNYDLNADGVINTADLGLLLSVFGQPGL